MKSNHYVYAALITFSLLNSSPAFAKREGSVIAVSYSGLPLVVDIIVCTNVNDPVSCEKHQTTNNQITLTPVAPNFYYQYMGFKIVTPGYIVQGKQGTLATNRFGYVITPGSASSPAVNQIGQSSPSCNGLTAVNLGDGVNWRCYDLPANSRTSCSLPPKINCSPVATTVPTTDQINTLYARFSVSNSQNIFAQSTNALIANMPNNPFFTPPDILQINTPLTTVSAASWSTDWGTQNLTFSSQQLCPCEM